MFLKPRRPGSDSDESQNSRLRLGGGFSAGSGVVLGRMAAGTKRTNLCRSSNVAAAYNPSGPSLALILPPITRTALLKSAGHRPDYRLAPSGRWLAAAA